MGTRAKLASVLASLGVLTLGWQVSTVGGQTAAATTNATTTTVPTTTATAASTTGTSTEAATSGVSGTFTGTTSTHRYGSVTVTVTLSGGQVAALSEQVVDDGDRKSQMISQRSIPVLKAAILAADSADVSTVSGATYTTDAYLTSLQSALDQAAAR